MKKVFFTMGRLVAALVLVTMLVGCSTTHYQVQISNVPNIREIYIRNARAANWGSNVLEDIQNIDRSKYSARVDIRVVDGNGIVYSKENVPFDENSFALTNTERYMGLGTQVLMLVVLLAVGIPLGIMNGGGIK